MLQTKRTNHQRHDQPWRWQRKLSCLGAVNWEQSIIIVRCTVLYRFHWVFWDQVPDPISLFILFLFLLGQSRPKSLRFFRFKSDRIEIWHKCSSSVYASIDMSGFRYDVILSRWRPWRHFAKSLYLEGNQVSLWRLSFVRSLSENRNLYWKRFEAFTTYRFGDTLDRAENEPLITWNVIWGKGSL